MQNRNNIILFSYKYFGYHSIFLMTKFKFDGVQTTQTMHDAIKTKTNVFVLKNIFSWRYIFFSGFELNSIINSFIHSTYSNHLVKIK